MPYASVIVDVCARASAAKKVPSTTTGLRCNFILASKRPSSLRTARERVLVVVDDGDEDGLEVARR